MLSNRGLPCSHEAVLLVWEPLNNVLDLDTLLPLFNSLLVLALGWQHGVWDGHTWGIARVHHGWVTRCGSLEWSSRLRGEIDNLASPAEADNAPVLDVTVLALNLFEDFGDALDGLRWCSSGLEEVAELLALFLL